MASFANIVPGGGEHSQARSAEGDGRSPARRNAEHNSASNLAHASRPFRRIVETWAAR